MVLKHALADVLKVVPDVLLDFVLDVAIDVLLDAVLDVVLMLLRLLVFWDIKIKGKYFLANNFGVPKNDLGKNCCSNQIFKKD